MTDTTTTDGIIRVDDEDIGHPDSVVKKKKKITLKSGHTVENKHLMKRTGIDITPFYRYNSKATVKRKYISIATHTSTGGFVRFQRLLDMASRWDGYISVAVHVKQSEIGEENLTKDVDALIDKYSSFFKDKVAFHLVIDRRESKESEFYPMNLLRNVAMENTVTDLVLNLDIDFIPSLNSHNQLLTHMSHLKNNTKAVMILPSFERSLATGEDWDDVISSDLISSKIQLINEMKTKSPVTISKKKLYSPFNAGHEPTDFPRWYNASDVYMVKYYIKYEPYYVVRKSETLPLFWEHFTGFGQSKLSWNEEMAILGYEFYVNPDAFLIQSKIKLKKQKATRQWIHNEYFKSFRPYLKETYGIRKFIINLPGYLPQKSR